MSTTTAFLTNETPLDVHFMWVQLSVAAAMFVCVLLFTTVPYFIIARLKTSRTSTTTGKDGLNKNKLPGTDSFSVGIGRMSCFAGGVFITTGFLDLFPDTDDNFRRAGQLLNLNIRYPLAPFTTLFGFLLILTIEQIIRTSKDASKRPQHNDMAPHLESSSHSQWSSESFPTEGLEPDFWSSQSPLLICRGNGNITTETNGFHHQKSQSKTETPAINKGLTDETEQEGNKFVSTNLEAVESPRGVLNNGVHSEGRTSYFPVLHADCESFLNEVENIYPRTGPHDPSILGADNVRACRPPGIFDNERGVEEEPILHSHFDNLPYDSSLRTVVLVFAICIHAVFEGMALGLQTESHGFFTLLLGLLLHKSVVAAGVGVQLATSSLPSWLSNLITFVFSLASPLGIFAGVLIRWLASMEGLSGGMLLLTGTLQGIACGTFFYIVFFEMLPHEFQTNVDRLGKLLSVCAGFCLIAIYMFFC